MGQSTTGAERLRRFRQRRRRIDYLPSPETTEVLWRVRGNMGDMGMGDSKLLDRIIVEWARVTGNTVSSL
jgi:hypothetical protein